MSERPPITCPECGKEARVVAHTAMLNYVTGLDPANCEGCRTAMAEAGYLVFPEKAPDDREFRITVDGADPAVGYRPPDAGGPWIFDHQEFDPTTNRQTVVFRQYPADSR